MNVAQRKETIDLPRNPSGKSGVLVDQVEQFSLLGRPGPEDISRLKEFFYALIGKTDKQQRRKVSVTLARCIYAPRTILIFLALEEIDIASPILLFSPVLKDEDLLNIIGKSSLDHARVIARRDKIGDSVIRSLKRKDDEKNTILKILEHNSTLRKKNLDNQKTEHKPFAAEKSQSTASNHVSVSKPSAEVAKPSRELKDISDNLLSLANTGGKIRRASHTETAVVSVKQDREFEKELVSKAREWQPANLCRYLSLRSGLKTETILNYVENRDVGAFASLMSVLGVQKVTAGRVLLLLFPQIGQNQAVFSRVLMQYEKLDTRKAREYFVSLEPKFGHRNTSTNTDPQSGTLSKLLEGRRRSMQEAHEKTEIQIPADRRTASA